MLAVVFDLVSKWILLIYAYRIFNHIFVDTDNPLQQHQVDRLSRTLQSRACVDLSSA